MKRPEIKDFFPEHFDVADVHKEYKSSPFLFEYIKNVDLYADFLEEAIRKAKNQAHSMYNNLYDRAYFCGEHDFKLEQQKFLFAADKVSKFRFLLDID